MKMKKSLAYGILTLVMGAVATFGFTSCSEDSDSNVQIPQFSGIEFSGDMTAGSSVTATAVQYKKGKYLDRTTYKWACDEAQEIGGALAGVFYDSNKTDPYCTMILPSTPGTYTVKFTATYNVSGKAGNYTKEADIKGGTVTYTSSPFTCTVEISQKFTVK